MSYHINTLFKQCESFENVSFDIFDTLLKRDVLHPTDVFHIVEQKYDSLYGRQSYFYKKRREAEKRARTKSPYDEVTFDEIYNEFDCIEDDKENLKKMELEVEQSLLHRNSVIAELLDKCFDAGKKIYIVSDMYLPQKFLEELLQREGICNYKSLFLSCVYRKTKRSGELFRTLCKHENLEPKKLIHIGDSIYADYIGARKAGISSVHIKRHLSNTLYLHTPSKQLGLSERSLYAFINTRVDSLKTRSQRLGYEVLGPIIFAYCKWLHETLATRQNNSKIWFVARDMYLFHDAYIKMYGDSSDEEYIFLSRKSLRPIYAKAADDITKSGDVFARGLYSLKQIVEYMGYSLKDASLTDNIDIDLPKYDIRHLGEYPEVVHALSSQTILQNENVIAELGYKYLAEHGLFDRDIVLADVGWHGTTQLLLQTIQKKLSNKKNRIYGMYLGCLDGTKAKIGTENYSTFVFDEDDDCCLKKGILLLESLILAPHGSTQGYKYNMGHVEPILTENIEVPNFIRNVQKGANAFIDDLKNSVLSDVVTLSPQYVTKAFESLLDYPCKEEIEQIGDLVYDNFYCSKMASPKSLLHYVVHIRDLRKDFKYSPWRIGFLYRLFKLRLPYARVYSFIRKVQGKQT